MVYVESLHQYVAHQLSDMSYQCHQNKMLLSTTALKFFMVKNLPKSFLVSLIIFDCNKITLGLLYSHVYCFNKLYGTGLVLLLS